MKRNRIIIILLAVAAVLALAAVAAARPLRRGFWPEKTLSQRSSSISQVTETESRSFFGGLTRRQRSYALDNGDRVVFGRLEAGQDSAYHMVRTDRLDAAEGTVWYYDADRKDWASAPLGELEIGTTCAYIDGDTQDYFIYVPIGYQVLENCSLKDNGSRGYLRILRDGSRWKIRMFAPNLLAGEVCDYTVVTGSEEDLIDFSAQNLVDIWKNYCHNGDGRWCYDGYYFPAPDSYYPNGPGVRYRCVAAYFASSMSWQTDIVRCAYDLSPAVLDTIGLQQNEEGYFPSMSESNWLKTDYGIPAGYYDTRFNSDLMLLYHTQMEKTGGFEDIADRYLAFYQGFARDHHYETQNGGWLVWDYNNSASPVHCSLNHQITEIRVLYHFAELLDRPELTELADRMLLGIEDTCRSWIKDDSNLHYCRRADGSFGNNDYPYLTYNDLYRLQKELRAQGRERNETLDILMEAKLAWMQENGVTGYETAPIE